MVTAMQIRDCEEANITTYLPKPKTSGNRAKSQFDRSAFRYISGDDEYECPAGERLVRHMTTQDIGMTILRYWTNKCGMCAIKTQCTSGRERRMTRWEHEAIGVLKALIYWPKQANMGDLSSIRAPKKTSYQVVPTETNPDQIPTQGI